MNETELNAAEVIAKNVELLESAYDFATEKMDIVLYEAARDIMNEKKEEFGWEGDFGESFEDDMWLAPADWRAENKKVGQDSHLFCYLNMEGEANTWLAHFAGGDNRCVYIGISTNTVRGKRNFLNLSGLIAAETSALLEQGFMFDAPDFEFKLPVKFDRKDIIRGFGDEDLATALAPIGAAIDKVNSVRSILDRIQEAVRQEA